jgi:hypothetical protein
VLLVGSLWLYLNSPAASWQTTPVYFVATETAATATATVTVTSSPTSSPIATLAKRGAPSFEQTAAPGQPLDNPFTTQATPIAQAVAGTN